MEEIRMYSIREAFKATNGIITIGYVEELHEFISTKYIPKLMADYNVSTITYTPPTGDDIDSCGSTYAYDLNFMLHMYTDIMNKLKNGEYDNNNICVVDLYNMIPHYIEREDEILKKIAEEENHPEWHNYHDVVSSAHVSTSQMCIILGHLLERMPVELKEKSKIVVLSSVEKWKPIASPLVTKCVGESLKQDQPYYYHTIFGSTIVYVSNMVIQCGYEQEGIDTNISPVISRVVKHRMYNLNKISPGMGDYVL